MRPARCPTSTIDPDDGADATGHVAALDRPDTRANRADSKTTPLVLDLDGTVLRGDTLIEGMLWLLAARPLALLASVPALASGRAAFKRRIAQAGKLEAASLSYDPLVLDMARQARGLGRPVYLATAADRGIADEVAAHLGLFDGVFASDGRTNLKGEAKARILAGHFGVGGFDYAGDSKADIPVWQAARCGFLVGGNGQVGRAAAACGLWPEAFGAGASVPQTAVLLGRAMRVHQWAKNLLVFVPLLAAHAAGGGLLLRAGLAFLAFSLCASGVYLLNDLVDLPYDRAHATKCRRPFASGALKLGWAPRLALALAAATLGIGLLLPGRFLAMLAVYFACTLAYSLALKRRMAWDVIMLAGLYTLRIFAGAAATDIPLSPWLLAFCLFLFFCLAVVKRLTELAVFVRGAPAVQAGRGLPRPGLAGRGYLPEDLDMLRSMAASSGTMAVLVLALYVDSGEVLPLYRHPAALWALCPILLFWVSRVLMLANRGQMDQDPVVFALRDRVSLAAGVAGLAVVLAATL